MVSQAKDSADGGTDAVAGAAKGTALNLIGSVVSAVVGFATVGLITNRFGPQTSGLFFASTALFTLLANGARLGSESGLTWFVARQRSNDGHQAIPAVVTKALAFNAGLSIGLAMAGVILAPSAAGLITDDPALTIEAIRMLRILAVAIPAFTLSQALIGASRGFGTMRPAVLTGQVLRPVSQMLAVGAVVAWSDAPWPLAAAWAVSSGLTFVAIGTWVKRRLARVRAHAGEPPENVSQPSDKASEPSDKASNQTPSDWLAYRSFAIPRALADIVSAGLERLDVLLVAILVGDVGAGLYGATGRLILAGQMMMIATAQSMAPLLASAFTAGRNEEARRVLRVITGWNVTLLWPVFLCLAFGAPTVLMVFGPEFSEAWPLVVVLSVAMMIIIAMGAGDTALSMSGSSGWSLVNHVAALAVLVGLSLILLPTIGILGAAIAWAASRLTLRSLAVWRVYSTHQVHALGVQVFVAAGAALLAYVPIGVGALAILGPGVAALAINVIVGGLIQLGFLLRLRKTLELDLLLPLVAKRFS